VICRQIRREPSVRLLAIYLPTAILLGGWLWAIGYRSGIEIGAVPLQSGASGVIPGLIAAWSWCLSLLFASGALGSRCSSRLDLTLPLVPKRLWLVHTLAVLVSGFLMLATVAGTVAMLNLLAGTRPLVEPGLVSFGCHLGAGLLLTVAACQVPWPTVGILPARPRMVGLAFACSAGFLTLTIVLGTLPRAAALVPLTAGVAILVWAYGRVPKAFTVVPLRPDPAPPESPARAGWAAGPSPVPRGRLGLFWLVHSTIWRSFIGNWMWLYLPLIALHGFVLSDTSYEPYFSFYFLTVTLLASWSIVAIRGLYRFDPLPVARSRIFASILLPPVVAVGIGYAIGAAAFPLFGAFPRHLDLRTGSDCDLLEVPDEYWAISWDGRIPEAGSDRGAPFQPRGARLVPGLKIAVYDPFEIPCNGSPDFAALQISRAVRAVYGATIPHGEIRDRYLEAAPDGTVRLREGGFTLREDYPGLRASAGTCLLYADLLLSILPWLLYLVLMFRTFRADVRETVQSWLIGLAMMLFLVLGIGSLAAKAMGLVDLRTLARFVVILTRSLGESLPGGRLALSAVTAVLIVAAYLWAQSMFRRTEFPLSRPWR
jgi:hypothetical protein